MFSWLFAFIILVSSANGAAPRAVYTLSQTSPNMLNIYSVATSGELTYVSQVSAGGNGGSTGSQGSLITYGNYIFGCNPASNTISLFSISATDATSVTLVDTADTGFDWPNSVTAFNNTACVITSGASNGIRCFTFDSTGLTAISGSDCSLGLDLETPPVFHTGPAQIQFTADGATLLVSVKNTMPKVDGPSMYSFPYPYTSTQCSNPTTTGQLGNVPFGFDMDSSYVVLSDAAPFGNFGGVIPVQYGSSNSLTVGNNFTEITSEKATCWVIYNSANSHFYTSNSQSASFSEISRSGSALTVVDSYTVGTGNVTIEGSFTDMALLSTGSSQFLYSSGKYHIAVLQIGATGATVVQNFDTTSNNITNVGVATYVVTPSTSTSTSGSASTSSTTGSSGTTGSDASRALLSIMLIALLALLAL